MVNGSSSNYLQAGGLSISLLFPIFYRVVIIFPLPTAIPSAQHLVDALKHISIDYAFLIPPVVEEIGQSPELLDLVSRNVTQIFFAGGDVRKETSDKTLERMMLTSVLASTECSTYPMIRPTKGFSSDNLKYFMFNPTAGIDFQYHSDNAWEAVFVRNPDPNKVQPVFKLFPDQQEYHTKDLFSPHPSRPGLWRYCGRGDDIIVFLTGEKTNPISMEQRISKHPDVRAALVIGALRLEAALLIELTTDKRLTTVERAQYIRRLWPTIQEANEECPRHAKVAKSHILFTDPDKPMSRSVKGTIQRRPTLDLYAKEIDNLYNDTDKMSASMLNDELPQRSVNLGDPKSISNFIHDVTLMTTGWDALDDTDDIFVRGMDSLQAIQLLRSLKFGLPMESLDISTIYNHPSVASLTDEIIQQKTQNTKNNVSKSTTIENMLEEYKALIDGIPHSSESRAQSEDGPSTARVVLLTGSTGGIGSYVLQVLLQTSAVARIYCLNRAPNSKALQIKRNMSRGLPVVFPNEKVKFLTAQLSEPHLGLDLDVYEDLHANVTDIIHNAWAVNFNLSLPTFRPHLSGVINLLEYTLKSLTGSKGFI
jgi:aryl carrier-like protein